MNRSDALGIFDSGVGGLTVVQSLMQLLPQETYLYLADTLHLPYGNKSKKEIEQFSIENTQFLLMQPLKALIIACHTASALAYESLKMRFNIPIFDVLTPAVDEAVLQTKNKKIAVLATESTIHSHLYEQKIKARLKEAQVISIACPLLVPLVEENFLEHRIAAKVIQQYLTPLKNSEVDTLILGCTHYPLLKTLIQEQLNQDMSIIDSALTCAKGIKEFLTSNDLLCDVHSKGSCHYYVTGYRDAFEKRASLLLNQKISALKKMKP